MKENHASTRISKERKKDKPPPLTQEKRDLKSFTLTTKIPSPPQPKKLPIMFLPHAPGLAQQHQIPNFPILLPTELPH